MYLFFLPVNLGAVRMLLDVFPLAVDVPRTAWIFAAAGAAMWICVFFLPRRAGYAAAAGLVLYLLLAWEKIAEGTCRIANEFIQKYNAYSQTHILSFPVEEAREHAVDDALLFFLLLVLWWQMMQLVRWKRAIAILPVALPGIFVLCLELMVGYAPGKKGLFLFGLGVAGLLPAIGGADAGSGRRRTEKIAVPVSMGQAKAGLMLAAAVTVCVLAVEQLAGERLSQVAVWQGQALDFQRDLEAKVSEIDVFSLLGKDSMRVSNRKPRYHNKTVMKVTLSAMPQDTVYLRGYVGDTYQKGQWKNTGCDSFREAAAEWGTEPALAGQLLFNMPYEIYRHVAGEKTVSCRLEYLDTGNDYAYLPYYTDINSAQGAGGISDGVLLEADAAVYRNQNDTVEFEGVLTENALESVPTYGQTLLGSQYEEYLDRYLAVPGDMPYTAALGNRLREKMENEYGGFLGNGGTGSGGLSREKAAVYFVRQELFSQTDYRLDLKPVPFGEDVVEFFLSESKEGFCQHYASAGALLLREMGVPARYVSGYTVPRDAFALQEDQTYSADVLDSYAHAWVEIYIRGVGWIPAEMTKGQNSFWDDLMIEYSDNGESVTVKTGRTVEVYHVSEADYAEVMQAIEETLQENYSGIHGQEAEQRSDGEKNGDGNRQTEQGADAGSEAKTGPEDETEKAGETGGEKPGSLTGAERENAAKRYGIRIAAAAAVMLAAVGGFRLKRKRSQRERAILSQRDRRRAIRMIGERIYGILSRKRIFRVKNPDDRMFREALRQRSGLLNPKELERYLAIAERAAYDDGEINREDVRFCYSFLKKVKHLK